MIVSLINGLILCILNTISQILSLLVYGPLGKMKGRRSLLLNNLPRVLSDLSKVPPNLKVSLALDLLWLQDSGMFEGQYVCLNATLQVSRQ